MTAFDKIIQQLVVIFKRTSTLYIIMCMIEHFINEFVAFFAKRKTKISSDQNWSYCD